MNVSMQLRLVLVLWCLAFFPCTHCTAQQAKESEAAPFKIETNVNRVLVPVVVRDKQGRAVGDLKKEDFQVFDNDKPHPVSAFMVLKRRATESNMGSNTESAAQPPAAANAAPQPSILPQRITVFLFDDMHLNFEDLAYAKKAGVRALAGALADSDMAAVVAISRRTNSGLTRDRAKLQDAIMNLEPGGLNRSASSDCPNIDYYQADQMVNKHDSAATADAICAGAQLRPWPRSEERPPGGREAGGRSSQASSDDRLSGCSRSPRYARGDCAQDGRSTRATHADPGVARLPQR